MVDLSTTYLGLSLKTPLVVSATPMQEDIDTIKKMAAAGASAVVLPSLFEEQLVAEQHELHHHTTFGTESFAEALTYFPEADEFHVGSDGYLEHITKAKQAVDIPIIASLNGASEGGWTSIAKQMASAGADALELNIYNIPTNFDESSQDVEAHYLNIARTVREAVDIPVAVKLSPFFSNMAYMAKQFVQTGINGLVLFNRFYQPDLDIEALEVNRKILLSTPHEMRLPLTWIALIYGRLDVDLAATTGIHNATDSLKMLMAGANVTMMASALFKHGIDHIKTVEADMRQWLEDHHYESVKQLQGSMSQLKSADPSAFERAQYVRAVSTLPSDYPLK